MRIVYLLILVVLIAAVVLFAVQNQESVTLKYWNRTLTSPISLVIAVAYVLGMVSGWSVVGFVRRSLHRVTEYRTR